MHTACVWSEKLPFAGYSVVKDRRASNVPLRATRAYYLFAREIYCKLSARRLTCQPRPTKSLAMIGGEYRARTGDLLVANQALSQLS